MPTDNPFLIATVAAVVLVLFGFALLIIKRYKRCPSNKVLVIYGRLGQGQSARCLHGGGAFVWPLIQDYSYLHLDPIKIDVPLRGALSMAIAAKELPGLKGLIVPRASAREAAVLLAGAIAVVLGIAWWNGPGWLRGVPAGWTVAFAAVSTAALALGVAAGVRTAAARRRRATRLDLGSAPPRHSSSGPPT